MSTIGLMLCRQMLHACPFQGNCSIQHTLLSATTSDFPEVYAFFFPLQSLILKQQNLLTFPVLHIMKWETKVLERITRNRVICTELHKNQDFLRLLYKLVAHSSRYLLNKTSFEAKQGGLFNWFKTDS